MSVVGDGDVLCPVCQAPVGPTDEVAKCPACDAPYHSDCWEYNGGCGVYGCTEVPEVEGLSSVEIPASYWGQEEKPCPSCGATILAAALRCRHCGATFSSAKPQEQAGFVSREELLRRQPKLRRTAAWILVLGIVSCTAPFAAIFGTLWYFRHRREIDGLPALNSALCKIGVGVAIGQTVLLFILTLVYGLFGY